MNLYKQKGFNLVELMIALAIGLVISAALLRMVNVSNESYRDAQRATDMMDSARFAMNELTNSIRHAGYFQNIIELPAFPTSNVDSICSTDAGIVEGFIGAPIQGYDNNGVAYASLPFQSSCSTLLPSVNFQADSDVIVLRRASTVAFDIDDDDNGSLDTLGGSPSKDVDIVNADVGTYYLQATGDNTNVDVGENVDASPSPFDFLYLDGGIANVSRLVTEIYYISPCVLDGLTDANTDGSINCSDASGTALLPTLNRLTLSSNGTSPVFVNEPVAKGVQQMQITYGEDTDGDGSPDAYNDANAVTSFADVVAVRIHLLMRAEGEIEGYTNSKTYALDDWNSYTPADSIRRSVVVRTIEATNIAGRREL